MTHVILEKDNNYVVPGFVDTHIHGAFGIDTCDGSAEGIVTLAKNLYKEGITSFCPTTMTVSSDVILGAFEAVSKAKDILSNSSEPYAKILGVHLEGPFLSPNRAGIQDSSCIVFPKDGYSLVEKLEKSYPGLLKIIDIAPELPGSMEFIEEFSKKYVVSLAHTEADYDTACMAFEKGATSVTHILNGMNACSKRNPGVLGAAFDNRNVFCEVICDGIHIDPTILRMLFAMLDEDRIIVVSDSMRGAFMPNGMYLLGTTDVEVKDGRTYFGPGGNLAGSVTNLSQEVSRLFKFGIPKERIIKASTINPLTRLGMSLEDVYGHNVLDDKFNTISTLL